MSEIAEHLDRMDTDHAYACSHHMHAAGAYSDRVEVYAAEDHDQGEWAVYRIHVHIVRAFVALLSWVNEGNTSHG